MADELIAYKAFNCDWTCQGFKFEIGQTYTHKGRVKLCESGFHAVTVPFDAWNYYPHSVALARVALGDPSSDRSEDSKVVARSIKIEASLTLGEWIKAQARVVIDLCRAAKGPLADSGHAAATGNYGHAAATGDSGHAAATGDSGHAAATGDSGHAAATGNYGIAISVGESGTAKAGDNGWLVLAGHVKNGKLTIVRAIKIGDEGTKAGVAYRLTARGKVEVAE